MLTNLNQFISRPIVFGSFFLILSIVISIGLKQKDLKRVRGAQNLEATYHVLLTISALNESPVTNHWLLPTVSLGGESNKYISWGATRPTKTGDYIYTSFTPAGFLAPYAALTLFDKPPTVKNLAKFNFAVGAATSLILFFLLYRLMNFLGYTPWTSVGGALVGSSIGVFSREAMLSHGIIYWSHSLYQLTLVISLWFLYKYLSVKPSSAERSRYAIAIVVMAFAGAMTEWSGYIFNLGLVSLFWIESRKSGESKSMAIALLLATAAAGLITVIHFSAVIGFKPAITGFIGRFNARSISNGNFSGLLQGYILSYGAFFIIFSVFIMSFYRYMADKKHLNSNKHAIYLFIFTAASIPLIENIIMLQHAVAFSFDRLKFIFPAALVMALLFCKTNKKGRAALGIVILLSCFEGYKSYRGDLRNYSAWGWIDAANKKLAMEIADAVDVGCAVFHSNMGIRAYPVLLFNRGIYERRPVQESMSLMEERDGCAAVYLEGTGAYRDLPKFTLATITYKDGSTISIQGSN